MSCHVSFLPKLLVDSLVEVAIQDTNAIELLVRVARLLDLCKVLDSVASILNDAVDEGEGPLDQLDLAAHLAHDRQECAKQSHDMLCILARVKEFSLLLMTQSLKILDHLCAILWKLSGRLVILDRVVGDLIIEDFGTDACLLVGKNASVHEDFVGDVATLSTFGLSRCSWIVIDHF